MFSALRSPTLNREQLARLCQIGRGDALQRLPVQATEHVALDQALPGGGLPVGAVTEILAASFGIGELRLVLPVLARLTRNDRYVAFVDPPYLPYPPALAQQNVRLKKIITIRAAADSLWAAEQMLRCSAFGAVLVWHAALHDKEVRRLQLAAEAGGTLALIYRAGPQVSSPAALRLALRACGDGVRVEVLKCRGGRAGRSVDCVIAAPNFSVAQAT